MQKFSFVTAFMLCFSLTLFSQHFSLDKKLSIRLGYSTVNSNKELHPYYNAYFGGEPNSKFSAEIGYKILPVLSLSSYIANSNIIVNNFTFYENGGATGYSTSKKVSFYGINTRFHCLPLFIKERKTRLDFYAIGSIGFTSAYSNELKDDYIQKIYEQTFWERGLGLGFSYTFTKHLGVFAEYQWGKFYNNHNTQWRAGIILTF